MKILGLSRTSQIFLAMIIGSVVGLLVGPAMGSVSFIGTIWLNMMKMFLVPIVIFVLVRGVISMEEPAMLGRVGGLATVLYMLTTIIAIIIAIPIAQWMQPGLGFAFQSGEASLPPPQLPSVGSFFLNFFSDNIFASFAKADMIQVLVAAVLLGIAIVCMDKEKRAPIKALFDSMYDLCMAIINIVMGLAPVGIFFLMAGTMGAYGVDFFGTISKLILTVYVSMAVHFILITCGLLWITTGIGPIQFVKKAFDTIATAASTCSSAAVIPTNLRVATENFGVPPKIADFCIPYGAQVNQDASAIMVATVTLFCAQAINVKFTIPQLAQMTVLATLVSAGAAAIPGGGIVRLMIVGAAFNMPMEIIAIVGSFYRIFDMGMTALNTLGDVSVTAIISKMEARARENSH